ncbi:hypothetical protein AB0O07_20590 [Streptomyces sp. NPDC093085]|uniref:hypothetical protein n=1 Tax=Streptomyces sp. NPDC093085 TaxID=3155068 RepID=UPI00341A3ACB
MSNPSGGFGLTDDPVVSAKNKIAETKDAVSRQSRELADIIATVSAGWTGVGAGGFVSAQVMINEDHDEILRLLTVLEHAVGATKNLSNEQDEDVRAQFAAAKSQAPAPPPNTSGLNGI